MLINNLNTSYPFFLTIKNRIGVICVYNARHSKPRFISLFLPKRYTLIAYVIDKLEYLMPITLDYLAIIYISFSQLCKFSKRNKNGYILND